jgi:hypothetical protein
MTPGGGLRPIPMLSFYLADKPFCYRPCSRLRRGQFGTVPRACILRLFGQRLCSAGVNLLQRLGSRGTHGDAERSHLVIPECFP